MSMLAKTFEENGDVSETTPLLAEVIKLLEAYSQSILNPDC